VLYSLKLANSKTGSFHLAVTIAQAQIIFLFGVNFAICLILFSQKSISISSHSLITALLIPSKLASFWAIFKYQSLEAIIIVSAQE